MNLSTLSIVTPHQRQYGIKLKALVAITTMSTTVIGDPRQTEQQKAEIFLENCSRFPNRENNEQDKKVKEMIENLHSGDIPPISYK